MTKQIRTFKRDMLEDETVASLDDGPWRLWVTIILSADDHGRFRANPRRLAARGWGLADSRREPPQVAADLQYLASRGLIHLYEVGGEAFGAVVNWRKHQRVDNASKPECPDPPPNSEAISSCGEPPHAAANRRFVRPGEGEGEGEGLITPFVPLSGMTDVQPAPRPTRSKAVRRSEEGFVLEAFAEGIKSATGERHAPDRTQRASLDDAIEAHAPSANLADIQPWLTDQAAAFARWRAGLSAREQKFHPLSPKGFLKWLNEGGTSAHAIAAEPDPYAGVPVYDAESVKTMPHLAPGVPPPADLDWSVFE